MKMCMWLKYGGPGFGGLQGKRSELAGFGRMAQMHTTWAHGAHGTPHACSHASSHASSFAGARVRACGAVRCSALVLLLPLGCQLALPGVSQAATHGLATLGLGYGTFCFI